MARSAPPPSPNSPDRRALVKAFQDVVRTEREKQTQSSRSEVTPARRSFQRGMMLLAVVLAAILLSRPSWLFSSAPQESPALREASLRVSMYVAIQRLERFRSDSGRLPASLQELGTDTTGLRYQTTAGGYALTGTNNGLSLTYQSGTPPKEFLGDSYRQVTQRRKR
jgi:hypothetical protein